MTAIDLFNLGNQFQNEGKVELAIEMWKRACQADAMFGPPHLHLHNTYKAQGNIMAARQELIAFLNCPITGFSLDMIPKAKAELAEIEKALLPQPLPPAK